MPKKEEFVYVTVAGDEVDPTDPAVQTRYTREEYKALDKAAVFGMRHSIYDAHGDTLPLTGATAVLSDEDKGLSPPEGKASVPAEGGGNDENLRAPNDAVERAAQRAKK